MRGSHVLLWLAITFPAITYSGTVSLADRLDILVASYPDVLSHYEDNELFFRDGFPPVVIDDGVEKSHADKLVAADIEDSLSQIYPAGSCETKPAVNFDPGRIRSDTLMRRLYGSDKAGVKSRLQQVEWFGESIWMTDRHGAADALIAVRDAIAARPELLKYVRKSGGSFNWRLIAGTKRLSVHSFGAAIDLNTGYANYWRWAGGKPGSVPSYDNRYPMELVALFEKHGFVWGGRWYHYDTMHFEYRPELISISALSDAGNACQKQD